MDIQLLHPSYSHSTMKDWHSHNQVSSSDLVYPIFVTDKEDKLEELKDLPEQYLIGYNKLKQFVKKLSRKGLKAILLFGVLEKQNFLKELKDNTGSVATNLHSPVKKAIELIKQNFPHILVIADVCLCAYTDHGHCGLLNEKGYINNKARK